MTRHSRRAAACLGAAVMCAGLFAGGAAGAAEDGNAPQPGSPAVTGQPGHPGQPGAAPSRGRVHKDGRACRIEYPEKTVYLEPVPGGEVDCDTVVAE